MTTRRRARRRTSLLSIILIVTACCVIGVISLGVYFPAAAEKKFGPSATELSFTQKYHLSYILLSLGDDLLLPVNSGQAETLFTIEPGESVGSIAEKLYAIPLIPKPEIFTSYLIYKGYDRCLRSGEYYLSGGMTSAEIAQKLCTSAGDRSAFNVLAGWRMEEIAQSLESYGFSFKASEFLYLARNPKQVANLPKKYREMPSLEGFLAPGEYKLDRDITAGEFILTMVDRFDQNLTNKLEKGFTKNGLSLQQAVTLASIVEKEAVNDSEKAKIAGVFYNRLAVGMNLETDPTVQYALGYSEKTKSWWKVPLSANDLTVDSPYNTYQINGLPPSPICSPGIESLRAVANPEQHGYYYFRAACDGSGNHLFAATLDEHIGNACP